jgi:hypothetical protein
MKISPFIQLKAAFLLAAFSLNTVIGFACSVGLNMGFNNDHHHDDEAVPANHSANHHETATAHHHPSHHDKNNCCNDEVIKLSSIDKSSPQSANFSLNPVFFTAFISTYYQAAIISPYIAAASVKYFARSHHPPIPDIRIAIQSFQI